ncbi:hypothetical protein BaRGS_00018755 [Batillaria attramentaria]|uniref:C-type lectin domain-containing protein n=1 Tax=Batillaria attramentaria TaxID=370345 RepID=A0ABD0KSD8_9CAEN
MASVASSRKKEISVWRVNPHNMRRVQSAKWTVSKVSVVSCARECGQRADNCPAFSYDEGQGLCYLDPRLTSGISDEVHYARDDVNVNSSSSSSESETTQAPTVTLPSGYSIIQGGTTGVQMKPSTNWQTAQNVCQSEGGHLFRMKTAAKKTYFGLLRTTLGWPQPELWVDATYVAADGNYVWGDGDPVDHSLFQSGFPGNKDCVKVTWDLQLQDTECTSSLEYVCEILLG